MIMEEKYHFLLRIVVPTAINKKKRGVTVLNFSPRPDETGTTWTPGEGETFSPTHFNKKTTFISLLSSRLHNFYCK